MSRAFRGWEGFGGGSRVFRVIEGVWFCGILLGVRLERGFEGPGWVEICFALLLFFFSISLVFHRKNSIAFVF